MVPGKPESAAGKPTFVSSPKRMEGTGWPSSIEGESREMNFRALAPHDLFKSPVVESPPVTVSFWMADPARLLTPPVNGSMVTSRDELVSEPVGSPTSWSGRAKKGGTAEV